MITIIESQQTTITKGNLELSREERWWEREGKFGFLNKILILSRWLWVQFPWLCLSFKANYSLKMK